MLKFKQNNNYCITVMEFRIRRYPRIITEGIVAKNAFRFKRWNDLWSGVQGAFNTYRETSSAA